jgi:hypothetical protein
VKPQQPAAIQDCCQGAKSSGNVFPEDKKKSVLKAFFL